MFLRPQTHVIHVLKCSDYYGDVTIETLTLNTEKYIVKCALQLTGIEQNVDSQIQLKILNVGYDRQSHSYHLYTVKSRNMVKIGFVFRVPGKLMESIHIASVVMCHMDF